jgi:hypothetical protein
MKFWKNKILRGFKLFSDCTRWPARPGTTGRHGLVNWARVMAGPGHQPVERARHSPRLIRVGAWILGLTVNWNCFASVEFLWDHLGTGGFGLDHNPMRWFLEQHVSRCVSAARSGLTSHGFERSTRTNRAPVFFPENYEHARTHVLVLLKKLSAPLLLSSVQQYSLRL